jgi:hypothetical protein
VLIIIGLGSKAGCRWSALSARYRNAFLITPKGIAVRGAAMNGDGTAICCKCGRSEAEVQEQTGYVFPYPDICGECLAGQPIEDQIAFELPVARHAMMALRKPGGNVSRAGSFAPGARGG